MVEPKYRVALKRDVTRKDAKAFAWRAGWLWEDSFAEKPGHAYEVIYATRKRDASIHYLEDPLLGRAYFVIKGPGAAAVPEVIRRKLATHDWQEALQAFAKATGSQEKIDAIYLMVVGAPPTAIPEAVTLLETAAQDSDPMVRHAVIVATIYLAWPECGALLQRLVENDPDEDVRADAMTALKGITASG